MGRRDYKLGDHWVIDDRTGRKIRSSEARKEWNGLLVHRSVWEPRQPQEFVRGHADRQAVDDPRPRGVDTFTGPLITEFSANGLAGDTTVSVVSSTRFEIGDEVALTLSTGDVTLMTVFLVPDGESMTFTESIPGATTSGDVLTNRSATTTPTYPNSGF